MNMRKLKMKGSNIMGVKVKSKGKTYVLNREEFTKYIQNIVNSARARKEAEEYFNENESEEENE